MTSHRAILAMSVVLWRIYMSKIAPNDHSRAIVAALLCDGERWLLLKLLTSGHVTGGR